MPAAPRRSDPIIQDATDGQTGLKAASAPLGANDKNLVKPVINALRILRFLGERDEPSRATAIAKSLNINASTCFNILRTMSSENVIAFDTLSKTYTLGSGLLGLVDNASTESRRLTAARPILDDLAERFGVTATLWRRQGADRIVLISAQYTPGETRVHIAPGTQLPMMMGASGRLFALHGDLSASELRAAFKRLRWKRPLTFPEYRQQMDLAERRGWAMDDGYFTQGVVSVAAPVFDAQGVMAFSLSALMFQNQYDAEALSRLATEMQDLSATLGGILC